MPLIWGWTTAVIGTLDATFALAKEDTEAGVCTIVCCTADPADIGIGTAMGWF
jgi:hypothetical protein